MKRMLLLIMMLQIFCLSGSSEVILARPEKLDFGNIYQGREYFLGFEIEIDHADGLSPEDVLLKDIAVDNRNLEIQKEKASSKDREGKKLYKLRLKAENILGRLEETIEVAYVLKGKEKKFFIPVSAYISGFYAVSPPGIVIRKITRGEKRQCSLYIETDNKSDFRITGTSFSSGNCLNIMVDEISSYRKKLTLTLQYESEGRHLDRLTVKTDNEMFSTITIDALANATGYIISDKTDIPFGSLSGEDEIQVKRIAVKAEDLKSLDILEITSSREGILEFNTERIADNIIELIVSLDPSGLERDFFGEITIKAKAEDITEILKVTYHGRIKK